MVSLKHILFKKEKKKSQNISNDVKYTWSLRDPKQWGKIYHTERLMDVIELQFCQFSLD